MPDYKRDLFLLSRSVAFALPILQIEENGSDTGDFLFRELGIDRKCETVFAQRFRCWKIAWSIIKMRVSFLEVNRHRIMNGTLDSDVLQPGADAIALWSFNHVAMPDAFRIGHMRRQLV